MSRKRLDIGIGTVDFVKNAVEQIAEVTKAMSSYHSVDDILKPKEAKPFHPTSKSFVGLLEDLLNAAKMGEITIVSMNFEESLSYTGPGSTDTLTVSYYHTHPL